jgi:DNA-binding PadR family transcriptional regulator
MHMQGKDIILGLLMESPKTGYEINERFRSVFAHFFFASYGMIYPTLRKLESAGEVEKEVVFQKGKPNKNVYHITEKGKRTFRDYLKTTVSGDRFQSEFLVRLYFGAYVDADLLRQWMREEQESIQEKIRKLQSVGLRQEPKMSGSQKLSYDFGLSMYLAQLKVLQDYLGDEEGQKGTC